MKTNTQSFRQQNSLEQRKALYHDLRQKHPDRLPVIVEPDIRAGIQTVPSIDRRKYLVPSDMLLANFMILVRARIQLSPNEALFLKVGHSNLSFTTSSMFEIYNLHHDREDGFLYITYNKENVYG